MAREEESYNAKHKILSLVGQLQHATKVAKQGRIFMAWAYLLQGDELYTRLNKDFCSDVCW